MQAARRQSRRLGKELWTAEEDGEKVRLIGHWDGEEEARWIGEEVEALQRGTRGLAPVGLDSQAILVRASHQMRAFEDRFLTIGLPYRVIGGPRFYERLEIRDAMAYFRLAVSHDDDLAFERVVNTPKRGLGDKAVQTIQRTARANGVNLVEGARLVCQGKLLGGKGLKELTILVQSLDRWHAQVRAESDTHVELAEMILDESGYTGFWQNDKTPEAPGRLENLKELVKALENFENLISVTLNTNKITDLSPLNDKTSITSLYFNWNNVEDLSPVASLTGLKRISAYGNQINDLSPLAELEKLEQIVNSETDTPYRVMNFHNTKGFTLAYGKLVHTGTSLVEHVAGAVDTGLFVDIFPFDGLPEKDTPEYDRHWKKLLFLESQRMNAFRTYRQTLKGNKGSFAKWCKWAIRKCYGKERILREMEKECRKYRAEDSKWVACQCGGYRKSDAIPKTAIEEIVRLPFEGHLINAPAGYETYLHTLYGDYHQLPPEDQRHPAHVGDAYWR